MFKAQVKCVGTGLVKRYKRVQLKVVIEGLKAEFGAV